MYRHQSAGVLWIHSARAALVPHVEWAIARAGLTLPDGTRPGRSSWRARPDDDSRMCAEVEWRGPAGAAARLASDLARWPDLTFEVTEDPADGTPNGERHCHVPSLGTWSGVTDGIGDVQVGEQRLRAIMAAHPGDAAGLARALDAELGTAWDAALEPLRPGTAGHEPWSAADPLADAGATPGERLPGGAGGATGAGMGAGGASGAAGTGGPVASGAGITAGSAAGQVGAHDSDACEIVVFPTHRAVM